MERISINELAEWQAAGRCFALLDVRRAAVRQADGAQIVQAQWCDPEQLFTWKDRVPRDRPVVFYCAHGHEISQGCAATLRAMGLDARYLIDGFSGWCQAAQPVCSLDQ
jgi:rhodanese-related sulfurtransferase